MQNCFLFFIGFLFLLSCGQTDRTNQLVFDVRDFGAVGDSATLNTIAIQKAVDAAGNQGGGKVVIPPGIFITGTILLKNNVVFEVQNGATILGSPDIADYKEMTWGHNKDRQPYHLIMAKNAQNITICGGGTINGNGPAFWKPHDPANDPQWILAKDKKISPMMEIEGCKDIKIKDVTLLTGGGWTLHLYNSDHLQIQGVKILNHLFAPNGDGIDITGCFDVTISDCIIKTCDDAICFKTTGDSRECKRASVTNCILECSCAALKLGNESFRDMSQITFSNCVVYGSSRAFAVYAEGGGTISDITVNNIVADTKSPLIYNRPIHISLRERRQKDGTLYGSGIYNTDSVFDNKGREPYLRNILISNFICATEGRILITAQPGRMIENLMLRDVILTYPYIEDPVPNVERAKSSQFSPDNPDAKIAKAAIVAENVDNLVVDGLAIHWTTDVKPPKEWQFKKRIANGTFDGFYPDYSKARQTEFHVLWGRNLQNGYINAPLSEPSTNSLTKYNIQNSNIEVIN